MLLENKSFPYVWKIKPANLKIMKGILKNKEMKTIAIRNIKNDLIKEEYNRNLKENYPKLLDGCKTKSHYEFDNDLMTLDYCQKRNIKSERRFENIHEEFKEILKMQNLKIESPKPYSIKENLKDIFDYRKKIALRFKYNNNNIKNNKLRFLLPKSSSQIINSIRNSDYNTINTSLNKSIKGITNIKCNNSWKINNSMNNNKNKKEKIIKEYEDKFMISGINKKEFKDNIKEKET